MHLSDSCLLWPGKGSKENQQNFSINLRNVTLLLIAPLNMRWSWCVCLAIVDIVGISYLFASLSYFLYSDIHLYDALFDSSALLSCSVGCKGLIETYEQYCVT